MMIVIRTLTAFTLEIDEPEIAVREILEQLNLEENLLENSVGFISCYLEFAQTGVLKAICEALPFDVMGSTTSATGIEGQTGNLNLTLMVITSDEVHFAAELTAPLACEQKQAIRLAYEAAHARLSGEPVFMIAYMPLIQSIGGEVFVDALNEASHFIPVFGTLAVDHTVDYAECGVIFGGEVHKESMAMLLLSGNIQPRFMVESLSFDRTLKQRAIITDSDANILKTVNGITAVKYLESLGLTTDGQIQGASTMPFVVDANDGSKPVVRAIFGQTPEGYAICGGTMPINATLAIGSIDYDIVMNTSRSIAKDVLNAQPLHAALIFSCIGRNFALGMRTLDEMLLLKDELGKAVSYQVSYSGGEVCPVYKRDGKTQNQFHNDTIVVCVF